MWQEDGPAAVRLRRTSEIARDFQPERTEEPAPFIDTLAARKLEEGSSLSGSNPPARSKSAQDERRNRSIDTASTIFLALCAVPLAPHWTEITVLAPFAPNQVTPSCTMRHWKLYVPPTDGARTVQVNVFA